MSDMFDRSSAALDPLSFQPRQRGRPLSIIITNQKALERFQSFEEQHLQFSFSRVHSFYRHCFANGWSGVFIAVLAIDNRVAIVACSHEALQLRRITLQSANVLLGSARGGWNPPIRKWNDNLNTRLNANSTWFTTTPKKMIYLMEESLFAIFIPPNHTPRPQSTPHSCSPLSLLPRCCLACGCTTGSRSKFDSSFL